MSHLSILPTVFTRFDLLETALGMRVSTWAVMGSCRFRSTSRPVDLLALRAFLPSPGLDHR